MKSQKNDSLRKNFNVDNNTISFLAGTHYIDNSFGVIYEDDVYSFKANDAFYSEFFLRYRWLDVTFSFAPKFLSINNDNLNKGSTKYFNLGFAFFFTPKLRQFLGVSTMKGFYLEDSKRFLANTFHIDEDLLSIDGNFIFPDLKYESFQGETSYLWKGNKDNYRSFTNLTYQPTQNEWIIMSGLMYQYTKMRDLGTLQFQNQVFEASSDNLVEDDIKIALKSGVGMQRILGNNWYVIAEAYPQIYYSRIISKANKDFDFGLISNGRIGFDNGRYFAGVSGSVNWLNNNNENFYSWAHWQARIGLGIRFNSPKFVQKTFDYADSKINKIKNKHGN